MKFPRATIIMIILVELIINFIVVIMLLMIIMMTVMTLLTIVRAILRCRRPWAARACRPAPPGCVSRPAARRATLLLIGDAVMLEVAPRVGHATTKLVRRELGVSHATSLEASSWRYPTPLMCYDPLYNGPSVLSSGTREQSTPMPSAKPTLMRLSQTLALGVSQTLHRVV